MKTIRTIFMATGAVFILLAGSTGLAVIFGIGEASDAVETMEQGIIWLLGAGVAAVLIALLVGKKIR